MHSVICYMPIYASESLLFECRREYATDGLCILIKCMSVFLFL